MNRLDAKRLAKTLLKENGLPKVKVKLWGMRHSFGRAKSRYDDYTRQWIPTWIKLSYYYVEINTMEQVRETILHEIAHLLTPKHGHNRIWSDKCKEIGGIGTRYWNSGERAEKLGFVNRPVFNK